jgi:hypothetical protein
MCGISHGLLYYAPRPKGYSDSALLRPLMTKSQYRSIKRTVTAISFLVSRQRISLGSALPGLQKSGRFPTRGISLKVALQRAIGRRRGRVAARSARLHRCTTRPFSVMMRTLISIYDAAFGGQRRAQCQTISLDSVSGRRSAINDSTSAIFMPSSRPPTQTEP